MRKVFCILTALAVSLLTAQAVSLPFEKTYKSAPLYEVLQDLESHFGLQFLYRPSDIAAAQPVTLTIKTNDAHKALQQALGESLNFTTRNGIIIITKAPEKKPAPTRVRSVVIKETPKIIIPDTLPEEESREEWQAIPLLTPGEKLYISPIDTLRIGEISISMSAINRQQVAHTHTPSHDIKKFNPNKVDLLNSGFYIAFSAGYGDALSLNADVRYHYYFHRNWGAGIGFNYTVAARVNEGVFQDDMRMGIPIAAYTRWPLSKRWGFHGSLGVFPAIKVYNGGFSGNDVELVPFGDANAYYIITPHFTLLMGVYGRFAALNSSFSPWSIGLHLGFLIGK